MDLQAIVGDFSPRQNDIRLRFGAVVSAQVGSITITVAGSTTQISGVKYLASYSSPTANDVVALLTDGLDILVIGKVA